ncbi:MAG: FixG Ig-like domain-containing protein, partial [Pseudomonadota bacterium]|nr:FixG Ig-like domain-containing protein [Pseudomonadota bacterium]
KASASNVIVATDETAEALCGSWQHWCRSTIAEASLQVPEKITVEAGQMKRVPVTVVADGYELKSKVTPISFHIQALEDADIAITKETKFYRD